MKYELKFGMNKNIWCLQRLEDWNACCQNADQEIFQPESFFCSIHSAIHSHQDEFYVPPDLWKYHYLDEVYTA